MSNVYYGDLIKLFPLNNNHKLLINIRGCNGSGKSTIPMSLINSDSLAFELEYLVDGKYKTLGVVLPSYNSVVIGHYKTKCGGLDTVKDTQGIKDAVKMLWGLNYHIIMEGIMASTVRQTYIDLFTDLNKSQDYKRTILIYNLLPSLEVCLDRIQKRNGGKPIKSEQVKSKWETVKRNISHFKNAGFISLEEDNSNIRFEETANWFLREINKYVSNLSAINFQTKPATNKQELAIKLDKDSLYVTPDKEIEHYPWFNRYSKPDSSVRINPDNFDTYWYFIAERMNIYWKRVVELQPQPWTNDKILQNYRFTNVVRDMDKLSIYVKKNILDKIDEPCDDLVKREKEILLNIMIFRLFVKVETWECIGFLTLDNFDKQWKKACENLRARKNSGQSMFTSAYYVCGLWTPMSKKELHDKTENAIILIENYWLPKLDEIYHHAKSDSMGDFMKFMSSLSNVGAFTAYEYACDLGMITRYCKHHLVDWTNDYDTNVGPGAKRGLDYIFEDLGNLSYYEAILYLRSIWKHELQKRGYYDKFIKQLPKEMNGDIDLRVIEHCLCETSKYNKAKLGGGRPKESFKPRTQDLNSLKV